MSRQFDYEVNPTVPVTGVYTPSGTGIWTATLPQAIYDRELLRLAVQGPLSSKLECYLSSVQPSNLFDTTPNGVSNTADYSGGPVMVMSGSTVIVRWLPSIGSFTGNETVSCTFFVRQAS